MPASFNHDPLFATGPRRFAEGPSGEYNLTKARVNPFDAGSQPIGPLELTVTVRGRLIAANEADLWSQRDYITSHLTNPPTIASLIDDYGHEWENMSFVAFKPADRTDRGRELSLAYEATFIRFL